jgi:hypothetical protein
VLLPDGLLYADLEGKWQGRGAYLCPKRSCVERALQKKKLEKAFRQPLSAPDPAQFLAHLTARQREKIALLLGLAQKAGQLISGHARLTQALQRGEILLLLFAADISPERKAEYEQLCRPHQLKPYLLFTKAELGTFLGKAVRSAVGITDARLAKVLAHYFSFAIP